MPRRLIPVIILCLFHTVWAQDPAVIHEKILAAETERNYLTAIAELETLRNQSPEIFVANNFDYLLGRMAEKAGDFSAASANYFAVEKRNSVLKEYALWHLARIAGASGNLLLERMYLQELLTLYPNSLLRSNAINRLARNWFESQSYESTINTLNTSSDRTGDSINRANLALLAEAYFRSRNFEKARELFTRLITETPDPTQPDDFALAGARGLDLLDGGAENLGKSAPPLSEQEHRRRAFIYQFNRDFEDARLHYNSMIAHYPTSELVPEAVYLTGRGYAQQGNYSEAIHWFERILEQHGSHPIAADALLQAASAYARVLKYRESTVRYQRFIEQYPNDGRVRNAYLNIIDVLRDSREDTKAQQWAVKVQEIFRGRPPEALALFAEARIYISRGDWQSASDALRRLRTLPELGGTNVSGGTTAAEVTFLQAYSLEQMRRYADAIDLYLSIPEGRDSYYGGLATERLQFLANQEPARAAIEEKRNSLRAERRNDPDFQRQKFQAELRMTETVDERQRLLDLLEGQYAMLPAYKSAPSVNLIEFGRRELRKSPPPRSSKIDHQIIAEELLFLGLSDEAAPELEAHLRSPGKTLDQAPGSKADMEYTIAYHYGRGDMANKAAAFIERHWRMPDDYQPELIPPQLAAMLYSAPYSDLLLRYAPPGNVDPRFLLSIMRQESRFRADVKSNAAARGLMQFISSTSRAIAGQLDDKNFRQEDLYDPAVAILFGSQYVSNLFRMFPNQPAAVAASYNGGEENVKRWVSRSWPDLPDVYVAEIAFGQTKDYVYRVMANYRMYKMLYHEDIRTKR